MNTIVYSDNSIPDNYQVGIFPNWNNTKNFLAMTSTKSKEFKTYAGAVRWMKRNNVKGF